MLESKFQSELRNEIEQMLEGCIIFKTDANQIQGFPDLLILYKDRWAVLECKKSANEPFQPNQEYYINYLSELSFARVIYPENKQEVLDELQRTFQPRRATRVSRRK
jgi:hypothetical protein